MFKFLKYFINKIKSFRKSVFLFIFIFFYINWRFLHKFVEKVFYVIYNTVLNKYHKYMFIFHVIKEAFFFPYNVFAYFFFLLYVFFVFFLFGMFIMFLVILDKNYDHLFLEIFLYLAIVDTLLSKRIGK